MKEVIPRAFSGKGKEIFENIHLPLLKSSRNFDRVTSFFSPKGFAKAIGEISDIWKSGGKIRMILSPQDSSVIYQALENIVGAEKKRLKLEESIELAIRNIKGTEPEILSALEEILINDLLQVVVIVPKDGPGLFHSKFSIYHIDDDSEYVKDIAPEVSKFVAVHGSFNETGMAYSENIEDASTHRSWVSSEWDVAKVFKMRFDELWNDLSSDSISVPMTDVFRRSLDLPKFNTESKEKTISFNVNTYLNRISTIPYSSGFNESIWLMPHQVSVVNSSMQYLPVRSMLCDEVGLGKTIQAGAIMSRLIIERIVEKVLIIAPSATLTQWAIEISGKFGYSVSLYRNDNRERYANGELIGRKRSDYRNSSRNLTSASTVTIISSQWFRRQDADWIEEIVGEYQIMILDEAHHARIRNWKKRQGTVLYHKIKLASESVANILLLTATPFQTGKSDYLGLLNLLQTVSQDDESDLLLGEGIVSGEIIWNRNQKSKLIRSLSRRLDMIKPIISSELYESILEAEKPLSMNKVIQIGNDNVVDEKLLFQTLPTNLSMFRNTRGMLREIGMGFPEVIFESIAVETNEYSDVILQSHNFILKYLGGQDSVSGFTRSTYYQRAISSINALISTLSMRKEGILFSERDNLEYESDSEELSPAGLVEIRRIDILLDNLEKIVQQSPDPKLRELTNLVDRLMKENRKVLIFSRYTATTSSIENELYTCFPHLSIGRYDGDCIRIRKSGKTFSENVTKEVLVSQLNNGRIDLVICSDAASEGLNFLSASAVINVDVPWNPARVMQRIGRVDRLGQLSPSVLIFNLVYFGTIEERMYRVLDGRQTDAIRYLGEHPELFSTDESRYNYQAFGIPIRERVDPEKSKLRQEVKLSKLISQRDTQDLYLNSLIQKFIDNNPDLNLSANPASPMFVMRDEKVLASEIKLNPIVRGKIGYAVCGQGVRHALLISNENGFIPITPSFLINQDIVDEVKYYDISESVQKYCSEFGSYRQDLRSPGFMSKIFEFDLKKNINFSFEEG